MLRDDALLAFRAPRHQQAARRPGPCSRSPRSASAAQALPSIASVSRLLLETRSRPKRPPTRIDSPRQMLALRRSGAGGRPPPSPSGPSFTTVPRAEISWRTERPNSPTSPQLDHVTTASLTGEDSSVDRRERVVERDGRSPLSPSPSLPGLRGRTLEDLVEIGDREKDLSWPAERTAPRSHRRIPRRAGRAAHPAASA